MWKFVAKLQALREILAGQRVFLPNEAKYTLSSEAAETDRTSEDRLRDKRRSSHVTN